MTPAEFVRAVLATVDELALLYAGTPDDASEASLARFAERTRRGWRKTFQWLPEADVDSVVADICERIRRRRREIEQVPGRVCVTLAGLARHAAARAEEKRGFDRKHQQLDGCI